MTLKSGMRVYIYHWISDGTTDPKKPIEIATLIKKLEGADSQGLERWTVRTEEGITCNRFVHCKQEPYRHTVAMQTGETIHIGDGAYLHYDGFGFELRANHHNNPTDRVYIDGPRDARLLVRLIKETLEEAKR